MRRWGIVALLVFFGVESVAAPVYLDIDLKKFLASTHGSSPEHRGESVSVFIQLKHGPLRGRGNLSRREYLKLLMARARSIQKNSSVEGQFFWISNSILMPLHRGQIARLAQDPRVAYLVLNRSQKLLRRPKVARAVLDRSRGYTYGLKLMGIPAVHEGAAPLLGTGQVLGVLDSGADGAHPEFTKKIVGWKDFVNGEDAPYDDDGHGTRVAGTMVGGRSSGTQIGVAPKARLIVGKILDAEGDGNTKAILSAMEWIADPDGRPETEDAPLAVNNSWASEDYDASIPPEAHPFCRAVDTWSELGILAVAAAGNEGPKPGTVGIIARCPNALAVGAVNSNDLVPDFSSRGPVRWLGMKLDKPEIYAPGEYVYSARPGGLYGRESGTSMAAPHVAGLVALLRQQSPGLGPQDLAQTLVQSATVVGEIKRAEISR